MKYEMARSLSGHDKDGIYLIVKKEGRFAWLVNGTAHTCANPKKKNEKHYQVIKQIPEHIRMRLEEKEILSDDIVRWAVRAYEKSIKTISQ